MEKIMQIHTISIHNIKAYENNPRKITDEAVDKVANSIQEFGFKVPVILDKNNVIVCGHTRILAAKKLGLEEIPCVVADDLTDEQIKAFRLADNKLSELSGWDFEKLDIELEGLDFNFDMSDFGFECYDDGSNFFSRKERNDTSYQEDNDEYNEFLDKFNNKNKKTSDDCYTPENIYEAVIEWVENEYKVDKKFFLRPFYPGGNYQKFKYPNNCIVVDNPPFSILSEITRFYIEKKIKFFLFAPTLTLFSGATSLCCSIGVGVSIVYENGAVVSTSFITNLENSRLRSAPLLYQKIKIANDVNRGNQKGDLSKYEYPAHVITSTKLAYFSKYGVSFTVDKNESVKIDSLDSMEKDKSIYGDGYLLSNSKAEEKVFLENNIQKENKKIILELSEREWQIVKSLGDVNGSPL